MCIRDRISAPAAERYPIANAATNELPHGAATIGAGDTAALVLIVSYPCTATPSGWQSVVSVELNGTAAGPHLTQTLVDFTGRKPAWLTQTLHDACNA